jgi:hypothetical protein
VAGDGLPGNPAPPETSPPAHRASAQETPVDDVRESEVIRLVPDTELALEPSTSVEAYVSPTKLPAEQCAAATVVWTASVACRSSYGAGLAPPCSAWAAHASCRTYRGAPSFRRAQVEPRDALPEDGAGPQQEAGGGGEAEDYV